MERGDEPGFGVHQSGAEHLNPAPRWGFAWEQVGSLGEHEGRVLGDEGRNEKLR